MRYTIDTMIEQITLEENKLNTCSEKEKEIILSRIDQMISDLCQLMFFELGKTQKEIEEKTKEMKRIFRKQVQDDMTSVRQLVIDSISAAVQIGGGVAVGWGAFSTTASAKLLTKVGGAAQSIGQGVGQAGNISRGFKDAEQFKDQGLYEDSQRSISESHDSYREALEQRKRQAQTARDEDGKKFSIKRELTSHR